jgi:hypothetical protein
MSLFEKIYNHQILSLLEDSGAYIITSQERSWLKTMMELPAASEAFTPSTLLKLQSILDMEKLINTEAIIEKARSVESQIFHPHLRTLRRIIMSGSGLKLICTSKGGKNYDSRIGFPYKLEYSMVKRCWYLLWYPIAYKTLISTKMEHIQSVSECEITEEQTARIRSHIEKILEKLNLQAVLEVGRAYNPELSRILYAFSCFEKEVDYDLTTDIYTIRLTFAINEAEYVLSKLRFLGKRIRVVEGVHLQRRMLESANRALARYGE